MSVRTSRAEYTRGSSVGTLAAARRVSDRELQKHLQSLLHLKNRLRRLHDAVAKEYTAVARACADATAAQQLAADELSQCDASGSADGHSVHGPQADACIQLHVTALTRFSHLLQGAIADSSVAQDELSLHDRKLQHLMVLVDRATDIDMQCMSGDVPDAVITNGSPLFPGLSINDADREIDAGAALCAKAGRLAAAVRRLLSGGRSEVNRSAEQMEVAVATSARLLSEKSSLTSHRVEGLRWEESRLARQVSMLEEELAEVCLRLAQATKTVALREAAQDAIFTSTKRGELGDVVAAALKKEAKELKQRESELKTRIDATSVSLSKARDEIAVLLRVEERSVQRHASCTRTQQQLSNAVAASQRSASEDAIRRQAAAKRRGAARHSPAV